MPSRSPCTGRCRGSLLWGLSLRCANLYACGDWRRGSRESASPRGAAGFTTAALGVPPGSMSASTTCVVWASSVFLSVHRGRQRCRHAMGQGNSLRLGGCRSDSGSRPGHLGCAGCLPSLRCFGKPVSTSGNAFCSHFVCFGAADAPGGPQRPFSLSVDHRRPDFRNRFARDWVVFSSGSVGSEKIA